MSVQLLFLAAALATVGAAQQPTSTPPKPSSNTPDDRLSTPAIPPMVAVEGCVAADSEVPGRKSDIGEKMGLDKHFVLVNGKVVKGKAPALVSVAPVEATAAGMGPLYKIAGLTDEQLKIHVGRRVRIDGSFGNLEQASAPAGSTNRTDLVELNATTIRQVPGDCTSPKS